VSGSSAVTVSAGGTNQSITLTPTGTGAVAINTTATSRNNTSLQIKDGVGFPATQVASTDPNTLDDYEEGTWTPSLGGTATYTAQEGTYTKIGNLVQIHGRIQVNSIGTGSTTNISGLPFTVSGTTSGFVGFANNTSSSIVSASLLFNNATTTCDIYSRTAASTTTTTNAIFTASTNVYFSGSYRV
jgi:hypothetical protein